MKEKKINVELRQDLPIKFYLNQHLLDDHLKEDSVLYEITTYTIQKINENIDKELSYNNLKFTSKTLKYIFGHERLEECKERVISCLKTLIKDEYLETRGQSFFITKKGLVKFYNVNTIND